MSRLPLPKQETLRKALHAADREVERAQERVFIALSNKSASWEPQKELEAAIKRKDLIRKRYLSTFS